jgi:light-regulated signal transduction histidine kinase (bacteriophytochrome)
MSSDHAKGQLLDEQATIRALQKELEETNSGLVALTLELEQRVDERTAQLRAAHDELQRTNSELLQLTLELEERVIQRTEEIRKLNAELEERVRERTAELVAANKELEAFTYSVSHDLRAPLRHIDGFSKLLLEECSRELPEEARHYLTCVREGTRRMGVLVDDLLHLTRVGRRELSVHMTGLGSLVEEVRRELQPEVAGREIEWRIGRLPFVECDPALMKQVLANLLSNAVKFTRPRKSALIEVGTRTQDGAPVVFVRDNGVGFSMKYADKLFGVFQRLHRPEDFEGTGVGLAMVQRIVHKHGGRVWAEAELNKGATFYFMLGAPESLGTPNHEVAGGAAWLEKA